MHIYVFSYLPRQKKNAEVIKVSEKKRNAMFCFIKKLRETIGIPGNVLKLFQSFLSDRQQIVVLNGQHSNWVRVLAGVSQGSVLGPLLFLIYINDLSDNLESLAKVFADNTSLFSAVHDPSKSAKLLNDDLQKISDWAFK